MCNEMEDKFVALALLTGRPEYYWTEAADPLVMVSIPFQFIRHVRMIFGIAIDNAYSPEEYHAMTRLISDYTLWYHKQEEDNARVQP